MLSRQISRSIGREGIRLHRPPIASPAQIIRAVLLGLLFAFFLVWALPRSPILLASRSSDFGWPSPA